MNQPFPFLFGISEFTTQPWTFEQDVERYAELGVEMIEVCEAKLNDERYREQMAMISGHGLKISAVQPLVRTFGSSRMVPQPEELSARTSRLRTSIERLSPYALGCPFILNTGAPINGDIAGMTATTIREIKALAGFAADHGVKLALEPLNASSMNTESAIWTVAQALEIIDAVDHENAGICLDLWNSWQDADIENQIQRAGSRIFTVQVSDWRTPRSFGDRLIPGDGDIPIGKLLQTIHDNGYRGACTVEIFSLDVTDSLYQTDLSELIRRSRKGLKDAWVNRPVSQ